MKKLFVLACLILAGRQAQGYRTFFMPGLDDAPPVKRMFNLLRLSWHLALFKEKALKQAAELLDDHPEIINIPLNKGKTALMEAASWADAETVKFLIERGARVELHDDAGWTALMYAKYWKNEQTLSVLIHYATKSKKILLFKTNRLVLSHQPIGKKESSNEALVKTVTIPIWYEF